MRRVAQFIVVLCLAAMAGAPALANERVANFENVAVARGQPLSPAQVRDAILAGASARDWKIAYVAAGRLVGQKNVAGRHLLEVDIAYDAQRYSVVYRSSINLDYRPADGTIRPEYNRWVRDLVAGINASLARAAVPEVKRFPNAGQRWTYRLQDPRNERPQQTVVIQVASASAAGIVDELSVDGGTPVPATHQRAPTLLAQAASVFSPYLPLFESLPAGGRIAAIEIDDPGCGGRYLCEASGRVVGRETVEVPAGRFLATKVVIEHEWRPAAMAGDDASGLVGGRTLTIWYATETLRAVKYSSRLVVGETPPVDANFDLELVSFQVK